MLNTLITGSLSGGVKIPTADVPLSCAFTAFANHLQSSTPLISKELNDSGQGLNDLCLQPPPGQNKNPFSQALSHHISTTHIIAGLEQLSYIISQPTRTLNF